MEKPKRLSCQSSDWCQNSFSVAQIEILHITHLPFVSWRLRKIFELVSWSMLICFSKLTRSVLLFKSVPFAPFCFFSSISSSSSSSSSSSALDSFGRWLLLDALIAMLGVSSINKSLKLKQQKSRRKKVGERAKWEAKTQWNGILFHAHEHMIACASLCFMRWLSEPGARREKEEASGRAKT